MVPIGKIYQFETYRYETGRVNNEEGTMTPTYVKINRHTGVTIARYEREDCILEAEEGTMITNPSDLFIE